MKAAILLVTLVSSVFAMPLQGRAESFKEAIACGVIQHFRTPNAMLLPDSLVISPIVNDQASVTLKWKEGTYTRKYANNTVTGEDTYPPLNTRDLSGPLPFEKDVTFYEGLNGDNAEIDHIVLACARFYFDLNEHIYVGKK